MIKHIVIGILAIVVVLLIVVSVNLEHRRDILEQELTIALEYIHELLILQEPLEQEPLEAEIQEMPENDIHYRVIRLILDYAPKRLREVFDQDIKLDEPDDFVLLPRNRILISGEWFCVHTDMTYTVEAIFNFRLRYDEIRLSLLCYDPFGRGEWRNPWDSPNKHRWVRYHELETVPMRFYSMGSDWGEIDYIVEYLNGDTFSEKLAYYSLKHLNRRIVDAWFVGRILYVNLHHSEPMAMGNGTFGELVRYSTLVLSMASVPNIEALVILVDGQREATVGGHGMSFRDVYLTNGLDFVSLMGW